MTQSVHEQQAASRALPVIRLDQLWAILAVLLVAAFISLFPTAPHDFWWHLKAGEIVATAGIPTTNLFAWTLPADHPYTYQSWLGEWLFYQLYALGGLPLTIFARNLLGAILFGLVAWETQLRTGSWRWGALACVLAAAMTINNLNARTQNWSWLPFMAVFMLLSRYSEGRLRPRWLAALPLIMMFWVNAHGAFIMGILVCGAFTAGETLRRMLRQPRALGWDRLRWLYLAAAGMGLATIVNPLGVGVFRYVGSLLNDTISQRLVIEWQTPDPRNLAGMFFYLGVLVVIVAFGLQRRRPTFSELLLVCGLAWQAFIGVRYVVWFGVVAMPIAAQALAAPRAVFSADPASGISPRERGAGSVINLLTVLLLLAMVVSVQPWFKWRIPWPEPYQALFVEMPGAAQLFNARTPVAAVEHLRAEPCLGPIFNEMGYGSYMAWALYPQAQAFIDPRIELYPPELWEDYVELNAGRDVANLLERYGIGCVLLDTQVQPALAAAMIELPGWERSFAGGQSEVWRR